MMLIEWGPKYELGNEEIDFQHQKLVILLNQFYGAVESGNLELLTEITLDELIKYTETHFSQEESMMSGFGLSEEYVSGHKETHKRFVDKIKNFKESYHKGDADIGEDMISFLKDWLVNHILKTDKELVEMSKGKAA